MTNEILWATLAVENARLYREAQGANRVKDEFIATLSHELRTPLTAVLGYARLLKTGKLDPAATEHAIESLYRSAELQTQLVNDLFDVSRMVSNKLKLELAPVDLGAIIETALDFVRIEAEAKSLDLRYKAEKFRGAVFGDADRLRQVICNLLTNAIKFTPEGGSIEVQLLSTDTHAEIKVIDDGVGVSPEFLPYVFEKFRQADNSSARQNGGLGLGLAIVHHLVKLHGGIVEVESEGIGCGSTFTVKIPIRTMVLSKAG
jgi:signal transduction histidine kinase